MSTASCSQPWVAPSGFYANESLCANVRRGTEQGCAVCTPRDWVCCDNGTSMAPDPFCRYPSDCCVDKYCGAQCARGGTPCGPVYAPGGLALFLREARGSSRIGYRFSFRPPPPKFFGLPQKIPPAGPPLVLGRNHSPPPARAPLPPLYPPLSRMYWSYCGGLGDLEGSLPSAVGSLQPPAVRISKFETPKDWLGLMF